MNKVKNFLVNSKYVVVFVLFFSVIFIVPAIIFAKWTEPFLDNFILRYIIIQIVWAALVSVIIGKLDTGV